MYLEFEVFWCDYCFFFKVFLIVVDLDVISWFLLWLINELKVFCKGIKESV